jgi:cation diffusion facilitator CzcD-associated flavoprotein CzcO
MDYDICIIGAGAYGFPLAAHVKRKGKKAIHLGGATQLLFGIKGRRWVDNPLLYYPYINLFNEHWCYPLPINKPQSAQKVEDACYW